MSTNPKNAVAVGNSISSEKKNNASINSSTRKAPIVKQTRTSKLRSERADLISFYKNKIKETRDTLDKTLNGDVTSSKESLSSLKSSSSSVSNRNIQLKTPVNKLDAKLSSNTSNLMHSSTKKSNVTSAFKVPSFVSKKTTNNNSVLVNDKALFTFKAPSHIAKKPVSNVTNNLKKPSTSVEKPVSNVTNPSKTPSYFAKIAPLNVSKSLSKLSNKPSNKPSNFKAAAIVAQKTTSKELVNKSKSTQITNKPKIGVNSINTVNNIIKPNLIKTNTSHNASSSFKPKITDPTKRVPNRSAAKKPDTTNINRRKSLSFMHLSKVDNKQKKDAIKRTQSWADISDHEKSEVALMSPIKETDEPEDEPESIQFKTPSAARRRSFGFSTPISVRKSTVSSRKNFYSPYLTCIIPSPNDLKDRLTLWLEKHEKPLGSFHHLRCFGAMLTRQPLYDINEENKENIEVPAENKSDSYENLHIDEPASNDNSKNLIAVAKDALYDLHKLIIEGYRRDQCEAWLNMISSKYSRVDEQPQYWECRAALEESRDDFASAVDCYKQAILKGAEVREVGNSLDNLLEKFSVLNISPETLSMTNAEENKQRNKIILDARNVFKSSIINFAIKERSSKEVELDKKYIATPVRRTTRLSNSRYSTTPGVTLCSSLTQVDSSITESLQFKPNKALH